jgi:hypothetical protein
MTATGILRLARAKDIVLRVQGDRLVVDAPTGALTAELRSELERHKPALVALLAPVTEFVTLRGGLTVPLPAFLLALDLERRGFTLSLDASEQAVIAPTMALTDIDLIAVGRWRLHMGAIVGYDDVKGTQ